jgi:ADP-heptose:LPS heptosyltransferase
MPYSRINNVKKIAVLKAGAIGDFIVTLPAILALRDTYPDAEIVLLCNPWQQQFLQAGRSPVDRTVVVPVMKGIRNEKGVQADGDEQRLFFERMEEECFDIAISFQGKGIAANPFIKNLNARLTAGTSCAESEKLDRCIEYRYYQHEVMRNLEIVGLVGAETTKIEPRLNVLDHDRTEVESLTSAFPDKRYVLLNPVASDIRRMWPPDNYVRLADSLAERKLEVIFTGSATEYDLAGEMISSMSHPAINACGISLGGLCALASTASLMISADTGPLHIAQAVQCPTVGIYWAPNFINWGPLNRRIHHPVISWKMECPYCGVVPNDPYPFEPSDAYKHEISFVRDITPAQVLEAAGEILEVTDSRFRVVEL